MSKGIWLPPGFEIADGHAIQALERGDATPEQQQRAIKYIVNHLGMIDQDTFDASNQNTQDYSCGRQFVARAIKHIIFMQMGKVTTMMEASKKK